MNIKNLVRSARHYARSEAMVAEIRMSILARKLALTVLGILTAVMGLAFINIAAYIYLQSLIGPFWTPLAIGMANFAIAALAMIFATMAHSGAALDMAKDLRNTSASVLEDEFQTSISGFGFSGGFGGTGEHGVMRMLLPAIIAIVSSLTRQKPSPKK